MKKIILITASFPYLPGEQFLETEVKYYSEYKDIEFTIIPNSSHDQIRELDSFIKIDKLLIDNFKKSILWRLFYLYKSMFSNLFYKEIFSNNLFNRIKLKSFVNSISSYQNYYDIFDNYFKNQTDLHDTIIYTYWNDSSTYALQSLKKKYNYKLVSRIHGYDAYKERRPFEYMPLKKQFTKNIDKIYTITQSANEYLHNTYGFTYDILELSRLGVNDLNIVSSPTDETTLHLVSCSFLVTVKQVDKIIDVLEILSKQLPDIKLIWSHIGNGEMYNELLELANTKLSNIENIKFTFIGNLENKEVYEFYRTNKVDVFINVSKSEGVPVSIMEAMSCHIPIIAPNIGGIPDMIQDGLNGFLLSNPCDVTSIVNSLKNVSFFKSKDVRKKSYDIFLDKYNADVNYKKFIDDLLQKTEQFGHV